MKQTRRISKLVLLTAIGFSLRSLSDSARSVSVTVDGQNYQCSTGGGGAATNCVSTLTDWCAKKTTLGGAPCFDAATAECKKKSPGLVDCIQSTSESCSKHSSLTGNQCWTKALDTCKAQK